MAIKGNSHIIETQSHSPVAWSKVVKGWPARIRLPFCVLPALFSIGFINSITELDLFGIDITLYMQENYDAFAGAITSLPRILSSLPHLTLLRLYGIELDGDEDLDIPAVKSFSLRALEVYSDDPEDPQAEGSDENDIIPVLELFRECSITSLVISCTYGVPRLEDLSEIFPKLRDLSYVSSYYHPFPFPNAHLSSVQRCGPDPDLGVLYFLESDRSVAFSELEHLSLLGLSNIPNVKGAYKDVLKAVCIRARTTNLTPIKSLTIERVTVPEFRIEDLERKLVQYVSTIQWV